MPFGRALGKGAYEFADTALLGILPESWDPGARTSGEEFAGDIGGLLGMVGPAAVGYGVGRGVSKAAKAYRMGENVFPPSVAGPAGKAVGSIEKVMDSAGAKVVNRLRRLRKLIATTENPKLKSFYRTMFRSTLRAAQMSAQGVGAGAAWTGRNVLRPAAMAAGKYPNVTKWGTAVPTALAVNDLFGDSEYYAPEVWGEE